MNSLALSNQYIFGLALLLAFIAGFFILRHRARSLNIDLRLFEEWLPWLTIGSLVTSRLLALAILDWQDIIRTQWWHLLYFWDGNLNLWGAIIGFTVMLVILCRKHDQSFGKWADALARPLLVMIIIGRLGNFFDGGVFYGRPTDSFPGIIIDDLFFPLSGIRHHSIALYEAAFMLIALAVESFWRRNIVPGIRFCLILSAYAIWRIFIETLRFDAIEVYENITWDQGLSALVLVLTLVSIIIQHSRVRLQRKITNDRTEG